MPGTPDPHPDELRRAELQDFRDVLKTLDERHLGAVLTYVSRLAGVTAGQRSV
jgi:hypothetical protein